MQNYELNTYKKLEKSFYQILKDKKAYWGTYCISLLQFIKPHTEYFVKYDLFVVKSFFIKFFELFLYLKNLILKILKWFFRFCEDSLLKFFLKKNNNFKNNKTDILFVTSLVNLNTLKFRSNINKDFIYGSIINDLKKKFNIKIIYINLTKKNSRLIFKKIKKNKNILVLNKILSFSEELKILIYQLQEVKNLCVNSAFKKNYFFHKLLLLINIFSYESRNNFRLRVQLKSLAKFIKPKMCVVSFEGNCWEKLVFDLFKEENNNCKNIGYQHGGVINNQFHLNRKFKKNFNPDYILTSGKNNVKFFHNFFHNKRKLFEIGSNRYNFVNNKKLFLKLKDYKKKICLVMPEGTYFETEVLFNFTNLLAKRYSDWNFILRTHPQININKFKKNFFIFPRYKKLPNLFFSNKSFDEDITISSHALYRGSTGIVSAILNGVIPIYYKIPNEKLNLDPIFELKKFKHQLSNVNNFDRVINGRKKKIKEFKSALIFCKNYFTEQKKDKTISIFNKINLSK